MNVEQIITRYKVNGLYDFKLHSVKHLAKVHGINYQEVEGFELLSEENKRVYEQFIVQFFNAWGMEAKSTIVPCKIVYIKESCTSIDTGENKREIVYAEHDQSYEEGLSDLIKKQIYYLRFEFELKGKRDWLHVEADGTWW